MTFLALLFAAALGAADVERLATYEEAWDASETAREAQAREDFGGRADEVVRHFLTESRGQTRAAAHAFVLRALADVDSTLALIAALSDPPEPAEGATARRPSEIAALLGPVLDLPEVGRDPEVAAALDALARAPRREAGEDLVRAAAIALLGRLRSDQAVDALVSRLDGEDPDVREMAVQSLGWMGDRLAEDARMRVLDAIAARLATDDRADVRFHAAEAIRHLDVPEGAGRLEAALADEPDAEVVDAIVAGLEGLGAPIVEPVRAREIVARGYDARTMKPLFERWRATASREQVVEAALEGKPVLRVLALRSLVVDPSVAEGERPPPPARAVDAIAPETEERLLESAVGLLGEDVSLASHDVAVEAAWGLSGGNLERLLERTDRIPDAHRRYLASWSVHQTKPAAYDAYRRSREHLAAGWIALPFGLGLLFAPLRRFAVVGLLAVAGWGASTYLASGPLDLPPWPYPLSKVRFLVPAAGALAAMIAVAVPSRRRLLAFFGGPILFLGTYLWTRSQGFFPPDTLDGWIFVFEPAIGVVVTAPVAYLLSLAGALLGRKR